MAVPSSVEFAKLKKKLDGFLKRLNPDGTPKRPMDDNLAKGLMRDAVRKKWMYSPTKLAFLLSQRIPDMNPATRTKWLQKCNICDNFFKEGDVNVDHIKGEKQFVNWEDAQSYASSILDVPFVGMQILCLPCHKTKSRCEALGLDWTTDEGWQLGLLEQQYTKVVDSKAKGQKDFLIENGVLPATNELLRKQQIREVLFRGNNNG